MKHKRTIPAVMTRYSIIKKKRDVEWKMQLKECYDNKYNNIDSYIKEQVQNNNNCIDLDLPEEYIEKIRPLVPKDYHIEYTKRYYILLVKNGYWYDASKDLLNIER